MILLVVDTQKGMPATPNWNRKNLMKTARA